MQEIKILIDEKGNVEVATSGFSGSDCKKATDALERALGKKIADRTTPEFFKAVTIPVQGRN